jgi:hypothetical protein
MYTLYIGELCKRVPNGSARKTGTVEYVTLTASYAEAAGKPLILKFLGVAFFVNLLAHFHIYCYLF